VLVVIAIAVVAVVVLLAIALRHRRTPVDGVANFQRQIDALSRDARKPTIEQLRHTDDDPAEDAEGGDDGS